MMQLLFWAAIAVVISTFMWGLNDLWAARGRGLHTKILESTLEDMVKKGDPTEVIRVQREGIEHKKIEMTWLSATAAAKFAAGSMIVGVIGVAVSVLS